MVPFKREEQEAAHIEEVDNVYERNRDDDVVIDRIMWKIRSFFTFKKNKSCISISSR